MFVDNDDDGDERRFTGASSGFLAFLQPSPHPPQHRKGVHRSRYWCWYLQTDCPERIGRPVARIVVDLRLYLRAFQWV